MNLIRIMPAKGTIAVILLISTSFVFSINLKTERNEVFRKSKTRLFLKEETQIL